MIFNNNAFLKVVIQLIFIKNSDINLWIKEIFFKNYNLRINDFQSKFNSSRSIIWCCHVSVRCVINQKRLRWLC